MRVFPAYEAAESLPRSQLRSFARRLAQQDTGRGNRLAHRSLRRNRQETSTVLASFAGSLDYVSVQSDPVTFAITPVPTLLGSEIVGDGQPGFWSRSSSTWKNGQGLGGVRLTNNVFRVSTWNSPNDGAICVDGIRIVPVDAEMAAGTPAANTAPALLQANQLQPIVAAAEARWAVAGIAPAMIDRLKQTQSVVTDLQAGYLGLTEGNEILLSRDAASFGWFVDPTPSVNEEFAALMSDQLGVGVRRLP